MIYAIKAIQPWEAKKENLLALYSELNEGRARFGWSNNDRFDLREIKKKLETQGWNMLDEDEKNAWTHAWFLLEEVKKGDYLIYINMPEYGKCTIVKIIGEYKFTDIWFKDWGDFRHMLPCEFIYTFDRNYNIVHPYLQRRLKLQRAWWRIYAEKEFEELLENIREGKEGRSPLERLSYEIEDQLNKIAEETYRNFPEKKLEGFVKELLSRLPRVKRVEKGPDRDGADLIMEYETGIEINGLQDIEQCAVQVKSYEGEMDYEKAIEDIKRAFESNPEYTCGLIVSTALRMTEEFEKKLNELKQETGKKVGVLIGKDLAKAVLRFGLIK